MPFFSRRAEEEEVVPVPVVEEKPKKHGLFGHRSHSPSPSTTTSRSSMSGATTSTYHTSPDPAAGGVFRRSTDAGSTRSRGLLHRFGGNNDVLDPSIVQARERVMAAEAAEEQADRALEVARSECIAAREHVKRLELEAKEDARRAKIKSMHAREVSKRAKPLGRHGI